MPKRVSRNALDEQVSAAIYDGDLAAADEAIRRGGRLGAHELMRAASAGDVELVRFLLDRGALSDSGPDENPQRLPPMHEAILNEHLDCLLLLASRRPEDALRADVNGATALMMATWLGPEQAVQALVGISDVGAVDNSGFDALARAVHPAAKLFLAGWLEARRERAALSAAAPAAAEAAKIRI